MVLRLLSLRIMKLLAMFHGRGQKYTGTFSRHRTATCLASSMENLKFLKAKASYMEGAREYVDENVGAPNCGH